MSRVVVKFENIEILFVSYCEMIVHSGKKLRFSERKMLSDMFYAITEEQQKEIELKCVPLINELRKNGFVI